MTFERACKTCHKRIGNAAFVADPQGMLAHYSCYKRTADAGSSPQPLFHGELDLRGSASLL